jgi:hypothetical protein
VADSLIELGVPQADVIGNWRRPRGRGRPGRYALLAVLAVLLGVVGSAPQAAGLLNPIWTATAGTYGIVWGADGLYVIERGAEAVSAHDAVTGRLRWRLTVDRPVQYVSDVGRGVVAVALDPDRAVQALGSGADGDVVLVAEDSGRVIATVPGQLWRADGDGFILLSRNTEPCPDPTCVTLVRVDATTGAVVAQTALGGLEITMAVAGEGDAVADVGATTASIRSGADFSVQRRLDLPDPGVHGRRSGLYQDSFVTAEQREGDVLVASYPLTPSGRPWTLVLPAPATSTHGYLYLDDCGPRLCLHLTDSIALIDRQTGVLARRLPYDFFVATLDLPGVMLGLAAPGPASDTVDVFLLRTVDGVVTARLANTGIVSWADSGGQGLLLQEGHDRTQFMAVDGRARVQVLGSVPGHGLDCVARGELLACQMLGQVRVWHLPHAGASR